MGIVIIPTTEPHFGGLYQAPGEVSREKRYLAFVQALSVESAFAFFRSIFANDLCQQDLTKRECFDTGMLA